MGTEHPWAKLAEELGGVVHPHWSPAGPLIQVPMGHILVTADTVTADQLVPATRVRALYLNPGDFRFRIRSATVGTELGKLLFGMQDIRVGAVNFDRRFVIQGTDVTRTKTLMGRPRIQELVGVHRVLDLVARPLRRWSTNYLAGDVKGVDELCFRGGQVLSAERLARLLELYREILEELERHERAGWEEVDVLTKRLGARGGTILERHVVLFDGDRPRRAAAVELGRLGDPRAVPALVRALEDGDAGLRGAAADALAALGDTRAVGPLSALLGDRERAGGTSIAEHAAHALEALGAGDLVDAFQQAVEGDDDALRRRVGELRVPLARALLSVMEGSGLHAAEAAGRTLGRLGVREVLPGLRNLQRATGWDRTREACRKAIAELEAMASLPRPAEAVEDPRDTLPRVAGASRRDAESLPRAAEPREEESGRGRADD